MRILPVIAAVTAAFLVVACSSPTPPPGVTVVNQFDAQRFMGKWYEIARFDHRFEEGLQRVTATYSKMDDGGIQVINRGYNPDRGMWQQTIGKAYFTGAPTRRAKSVVLWPLLRGIQRDCAGQRVSPCAGLRAGSRLSVDTVANANTFQRDERANAGCRDPARV